MSGKDLDIEGYVVCFLILTVKREISGNKLFHG